MRISLYVLYFMHNYIVRSQITYKLKGIYNTNKTDYSSPRREILSIPWNFTIFT